MTYRKTFFMDPERLFEFAQVPLDIPQRFAIPLYDQLWAYWLQHRTPDPKGKAAAVAAIKARQNGWCSMADRRDAGWTEFAEPMVPEEVVKRTLQEIIAKEPAA